MTLRLTYLLTALLLSALLLGASTAHANPAADGDALYETGSALYKNPGRGGCMQCHGESGNQPVMPLYPKIGGQSELYLYNQLMDYKNKKRQNGLYIPMEVAMQPFTTEEIKAMAHFLAKQTVF